MSRSGFSEQHVAASWDLNADAWAGQIRDGRDGYRNYFNGPAFLQFVGPLKGKSVLDAGCGEGSMTRLFANRGAEVIGVDISSRMIAIAQDQEHRQPLGIRYEVASFSDLALFSTASFDTIVSFMALMDAPDLDRSVSELFRVLRPQGEFIFSVLHPCFMTKGYQWLQDEHGNENKLTVADYFDDAPWVEHLPLKDASGGETGSLAIPRFPRTLSSYLNTLAMAGFVLHAVEEPRPSEEMCQRSPRLRRWRDHAAIFLYVCAVKP